ncbi:MAG TPA: hypothetical protein VKX17_05930 [Planctomycetota bacterium]|nr:hypothetical protein [Planctomycetota bacterium]
MRILFFLPMTRHTPVFEWALDIVQRHLDDGDEILLLICGGEAASCEINLHHRYSVCHKCTTKRRAGFKLLEGAYKTAPFLKLTPENRREISALPAAFESIDALKRFDSGGFDLGMAVASSMISCTRDPHFDLREHREAVSNLMQTAFAIYRSVQNYLSESHYDRVYVLNARIATFRAVFRAARGKNVDCHVYEAGATIHRTQQFINHMPMDIHYARKLIQDTWENNPNAAERERIGRLFYEKASQGQSLINYVARHKEGLLPEGFDANAHNVVIYNSSEDELAAVGDDWKNPVYPSQLDGLQAIRRDIDALPHNTRFYLRMHPHLRGVDNAFTRALMALQHPRFMIIPPDSPVSSYALLCAARTVLTFGSTMGMEAVYFGKPSVLAGQSFYYDMGATYNPATHTELLALLSKALPPKPVEPALVYGYFCETFGQPFKYFKAESYTTGKFKGRRIAYGRHLDYFWGGFEKLPLVGAWLNRRHRKRAHQLLGTSRT